MELFFPVLIGLVLIQRLVELRIAQRNAQWMKERGAIEFGADHYPLIVLIHVLFFTSMTGEVLLFDRSLSPWWGIPFVVFAGAQLLRWWCLYSLGRFWNTRIIVLPNAHIVSRGPYRFMRHPNYAVVMLELLSFPLIFSAYGTALTVSVLNFFVLRFVRIPAEERALSTVTQYEEKMAKTARLLPDILSKYR